MTSWLNDVASAKAVNCMIFTHPRRLREQLLTPSRLPQLSPASSSWQATSWPIWQLGHGLVRAQLVDLKMKQEDIEAY